MLEIKPVQEKKEQERIALLCDIPYRPDDFMYVAYVDGEIVGASQFGYEEKKAFIHDLTHAVGKNDEDALFIMGRQTVNFIDLSGTHEAYLRAEDDAMRARAKRIGFREKDGLWYMDLNGFFNSPCQH